MGTSCTSSTSHTHCISHTPCTSSTSSTMMKLAVSLLVVAVVAMADDCQVYRDTLQKFTMEMAARQERPASLAAPDGVCEDGEGWACSMEIVEVVMECIASIGTGNPLGIYQCVMDAIGAGSDCADCVCWVMSFVGVNC